MSKIWANKRKGGYLVIKPPVGFSVNETYSLTFDPCKAAVVTSLPFNLKRARDYYSVDVVVKYSVEILQNN